ncbi:hypothetical protein TI05_05030 [Achromatium sp. WMS3]|nr:hypothetical protein TI05_05030 [Achromatium sp. WMS3]
MKKSFMQYTNLRLSSYCQARLDILLTIVSILTIVAILSNTVSVAIAKSPVPTDAKAIKPIEVRWIFIYKKPVRMRNLMTHQERGEYRRAMRAAKTWEARQQIRELVHTRLNQRAMEWGMFIVIPNHNKHLMREESDAPTRELETPELKPTELHPTKEAANIAVAQSKAATVPTLQHQSLKSPTPKEPTIVPMTSINRPTITPHSIHPQHPMHPAHPMPQPPHH